MPSSDSTAMPGSAITPQCCSTTMLLSALAASFALSLLLVFVFLCLRFVQLRRRRSPSAWLLQEQQPRVVGLDAASIALLPSFPYLPGGHGGDERASSAPVECAICLNAVDEGEMVRQLPGCSHVFHLACIDVWLSSNASCPVCRRKAEPADARASRSVSDRAMASSYVVPVEILEDEMAPAASSSTSGDVAPPPEPVGNGFGAAIAVVFR